MDEFLKVKKEFELILKNSISNLDGIKNSIENNIIYLTDLYYKKEDSKVKYQIKEELIKDYNYLYLCQYMINKNKTTLLDEKIKDLPKIFILDDKPVRFAINYDILKDIDVSKGLTEEQSLELLRWTANNTRDNINIENSDLFDKTNDPKYDVYDTDDLQGACGFAQALSLYPLEKLGFKITINNMKNFFENYKHAFGTVTIPIRTESGIINEKYLIDFTYRQFFTIEANVVTRYLVHRPSVGYFVSKDEEEIKFAQELLQNGFVKVEGDVLKKYIKPFLGKNLPISKVEKIAEELEKIDFENILENKQEKLDYTEEQLEKYNLVLPINNLQR